MGKGLEKNKEMSEEGARGAKKKKEKQSVTVVTNKVPERDGCEQPIRSEKKNGKMRKKVKKISMECP
jgi:hypothetical protein